MQTRFRLKAAALVCLLAALVVPAGTASSERPAARRAEVVELQPLAAQARRVAEALELLGEPLSAADMRALELAVEDKDEARGASAIERVLDRRALVHVQISPESRVGVTRGAARAVLVERGWRCFLVKVRNDAGVTAQLRAASPQALPVYARGISDIPGGFSLDPRPKQKITPGEVADRWLELSMFDRPPLEAKLSGLGLEYRVVQLHSRDRGRREARLGFDVGQGSQDIGFRNDVPVLFECLPSKDVTLRVLDERGRPTTASFRISDPQGRQYPAKTKRLAPDFSFHPQVYREDGEKIRLPAGAYTVESARGPEYVARRETLTVGAGARPEEWRFRLKRWIDPAAAGWYSGDHHIHAAGCSHYEAPTQGVMPKDMMRHIVGEGLNVGDVLTWGPCYYFQKQFFEAKVNSLSTPANLMRYDVEVSGFPSSFNGHLTLLGLREQDYPGARTIEEWPAWDLPVLKWAKAQGAVVGFAHSGWGLEVKSQELPNYEMPRFDGVGANEYVVDV
ncbi:MAG TPA: CehA/McbA family metallohydrolase, partial [Pyrinomonadaceae bacterium]